jgi:hypothetical protein
MHFICAGAIDNAILKRYQLTSQKVELEVTAETKVSVSRD